MKIIKIDGPVVSMVFVGNHRDKAFKLKYVSTAWRNKGNTVIVVSLTHVGDAESAILALSKCLGQTPIETQTSQHGCDVLHHPHGDN